MFKKLFFTTLLLLASIAAVFGYYLQDEARLKSGLSAQLESASGYQVNIAGDLKWRILPGLGLALTNVKLRDEETQIHIGKLRLGLGLSELTKSPDSWKLDDLILNQIRIKDAGFRIQRFAMQGFALGQDTAFQAQILMLQGSEPSEIRTDGAPIDVDGSINYRLLNSKQNPAATLLDLKINEANIQTQLGTTPITAQCNGSITEIDGAATSKTDSLDVYNSLMNCTASQFSINSLSWPQSELALTTVDGRLNAELQAAKGSVNIKKLKDTISVMSRLSGQENLVANWPDTMQYQMLSVAASLQNEQVSVDGSLDNLKIVMLGTLDQQDNTLDLTGTVSVGKAEKDQLISLGPMLTDLPLPFYCKGPVAEPDCGPDTKAAMSIAGELIKREGRRKASEEIQESLLDGIEEKLPEGLRDSARQLLNLFKG